MKTRIIELFEKQILGDNIEFIAECNEYDETGKRVEQLSRSYFSRPSTMTDEEIINDIRTFEYSLYFQ